MLQIYVHIKTLKSSNFPLNWPIFALKTMTCPCGEKHLNWQIFKVLGWNWLPQDYNIKDNNKCILIQDCENVILISWNENKSYSGFSVNSINILETAFKYLTNKKLVNFHYFWSGLHYLR